MKIVKRIIIGFILVIVLAIVGVVVFSLTASTEKQKELQNISDQIESGNENSTTTAKPQSTTSTTKKENTKINKNEYIFFDSDKRYLTDNELDDLNGKKLRIARNEIFARYGYIFDDENLQDYFKEKSWYRAKTKNIDENNFNKYEKANIDLIKQHEGISDNNSSKEPEPINGTDFGDIDVTECTYTTFESKPNDGQKIKIAGTSMGGTSTSFTLKLLNGKNIKIYYDVAEDINKGDKIIVYGEYLGYDSDIGNMVDAIAVVPTNDI